MTFSLSRLGGISLSLLCLLVGCSSAEDTSPSGLTGVSILGNGSHSTSSVNIEVFATEADGLTDPRDLDFHPSTGDLWIANGIDSMTTVLVQNDRRSEWLCSDNFYGAGDGCDCGCGKVDADCADATVDACDYVTCGPGQTLAAGDPGRCVMVGLEGEASNSFSFIKRASADGSHRHFMAKVSGIAFNADGNFATSQEEDEITQPSTPANFMGPTLWDGNLKEWEGGHLSHLDMLHNSPSGAGIAWEQGNAFWIFDGYHQSLTRYDFVRDHGRGGTDHTDGIIRRFAEGQVSYIPGVPSSMVWDQGRARLLVADSGNKRILALDPEGASSIGAIAPNYDGCTQVAFSGETLTTLVQGAEGDLDTPSGIALQGNQIFVSDYATGRIWAYAIDGTVLDYLEVAEPNALMGMTFGPDGSLYAIDNANKQILRITAR